MPAKREQIEAEIAKRIPLLTPAEYTDIARRCAESLDKDQVEAMIKTWKGWRDQTPRPAEYAEIARRCVQLLDKDQVEAMIKTWKAWRAEIVKRIPRPSQAEIAKRVPRPTPAEHKDIVRRCAQSLGSEWISDRVQAALQDEAEQVGNLAQTARDLELPMHCNFCDKDPLEAMIKTWKGWYICSECVDRHSALLAKHRSQ